MAVITIDGTRLEVPENKNVLECALEAGIYIPHLCHHPDLPENGSCRMCIVEVEGQEGITTSCTLRAQDGMVVHTTSERINKLRTLALELLLAGHPEDCSTCPKYGNCELQTLIQYIGANNARMRTRIKGIKMEEGNPLLIHDMNRCVLCGRCVRACNKLRGVGVLQYNKKDLETYVGTLHGKLLKDEDCRFCTACAEVCPTGSIRDKLQLLTTNLKKEEALVPCRTACPAHTDIPRYIRFVKEGDYDAAVAVIREKVPFPNALGHVCSHACELECKRKEVSEAMSIRDIKRYAAEHDTGRYWKGKGKQLPDTGKKVCVVGGGPAGLTAAYYLRKQGHAVTVKEALPTVGGMMSYGIPSYRLPREIVAQEAKVIEDQGVVIETNTKVEKPVELLKEYDAVLMTIGAHKGVRLPMEGSELPGVLLNIDFLRNASLGQETGMGKRIIVLGGGNVAFDCARTAKRLGAEEIHLACLEAREVMTADDEEIEQAKEEGIFVHPAQTFERITGTDAVTGVDFMNVKSFTFDENRRAIIEKEEGSEHHIDADTVIFATGQRPDLTEEAGLTLGRANSIVVKENSLATETEGVFAAGDVVYGTKSVILAIASGRDAAVEIDKYLGGDGDISETLAPKQHADPKIGKVEGFGYFGRTKTQVTPAAERQDNFNEVDHGICDADICGEASRCLQCDLRLQIHPSRLWTEYSNQKEA
ncbi:ferredoxin [Eubacterium ramulus]|uniref:Ferredoxin n=1 Tax=Eubacterium ramulus TaxID=39490 RepID=A0A2V1JRB5_EUBRA|nr:FAD-dependent oxidoreductase [Eubacterium ramulus]PWE87502.1 ferredoxin [Eubacterium ramulus]